MQDAPSVPQTALVVPPWQTPFASQQPVGQLVESQTHTPPPAAATHSCPVGQAAQAAPLAPQSALEVPGSQVVPLQHPVLQSPAAQNPVQT
jgi:hypothetical protein